MVEKTTFFEELEEEIITFLNEMSNKPGGTRTKPGCNINHGEGCALGTCVDNEPRVTPIDFFNEGMTVWIAGQPGGKIANIRRNPKVSVGIYVPVDHSIEQKSLQIWGTAELINIKNNPEEFKKRMESFGVKEAASGVIEEFVQMGEIPQDREEKALEMGLKQFNSVFYEEFTSQQGFSVYFHTACAALCMLAGRAPRQGRVLLIVDLSKQVHKAQDAACLESVILDP